MLHHLRAEATVRCAGLQREHAAPRQAEFSRFSADSKGGWSRSSPRRQQDWIFLVCAGWVGPFSRGLWGGALLLSTDAAGDRNPIGEQGVWDIGPHQAKASLLLGRNGA